MHRLPAFVFLLLLFLASCMTPAVPPDPDAQPPADSLAQAPVEDYDPLLLPEDEILLPLRESHAPVGQALPADTLAAMPDSLNQEQPNALPREGFQVQIHSGRKLEAAQEVQAQALLLFPDHPVEMVWDAPNYKIRVGFFAAREAAERLKHRARRLGYGKAWVVLAMREE